MLNGEQKSSATNGTVSLAFSALYDPSLGLQDADAECWALSMSPELVARLEDKEVKRQEHMYELILTEKHHCLTLALMQHLFVGDMKKYGFTRYARLLFPELNKLLEVSSTLFDFQYELKFIILMYSRFILTFSVGYVNVKASSGNWDNH